MSVNTPVRVLVIEDDPVVARTVREGLTARRFVVQHVPSLAAAQRALTTGRYDIAVFDLTLPDGDGLDLVASLRAAGNNLPVLVLTARDSIADRVTGLRRGADDYLCKPFSVEELVARLYALLRRVSGTERHVLRYADLHLDMISRTLRRQDIQVILSAREAELLAYFLRHPEEVLSRARILREVWGDEAEDESNVLNVYVNYLRNKIEASLHSRVIHTVRGVGYMLSKSEPDELFFDSAADE